MSDKDCGKGWGCLTLVAIGILISAASDTYNTMKDRLQVLEIKVQSLERSREAARPKPQPETTTLPQVEPK